MTASEDSDGVHPVPGAAIDIAEDQHFQRRSWIAERISWVLILLVLVAGFLGLFGSAGLLNRATVGTEGGPLHVEYAPFARHGAPTMLQVTVGGTATAEDVVRIAVSRDYLDSVSLVEVLPEPQDVELTPEALIYVFPVAAGAAPLSITFEVEPQQYWRRRGTIGLADGEALRFTQIVYP